MDTKLLIDLFKDTTSLKLKEIKSLVSVIQNYDETEELAYEAIGMLNEGIPFSKIINEYRKQRFGWDGYPYLEYKKKRKLNDKLLIKPPEIRDGEMECPKCHKKKTFIVEMQTRSADEGYTYYIHCFNPKCRAITK